jgi:hypothetical protein
VFLGRLMGFIHALRYDSCDIFLLHPYRAGHFEGNIPGRVADLILASSVGATDHLPEIDYVLSTCVGCRYRLGT